MLPALASLTPTVADTRGPFSMLLYAESTLNTVCTNGIPGGLSIGITGATANTASITPDQIAIGQSGAQVGRRPGVQQPVRPDRRRRDRRLTLVLDDGGRVEATTANGWLIAWWPGLQGVTSAQATTASGTTTQQSTCTPSACYPAPPRPALPAPAARRTEATTPARA